MVRRSLPTALSALISTPFRRMIALVTLANLLVVALVALSLDASHQQYRDRAAITSRNTCRLVSQSVAGEIDRIDMGLKAVVDDLARRQAEGPVDWRDVEVFLSREQSRMPMADALRIADPAGNVVAGSGGVPPGINNADRDYFAVLRADSTLGLAISKPLLGRIDGKWMLVFARRLADKPDGGFGGIVFAPVTIAWFERVFTQLEVGPHGAVVMRGDASRDFDLLARYPAAGFVGQTKVSENFRATITADPRGGTYEAYAGADDIRRIFSYQSVGDYPLITLVGLATDDYFGDWRADFVKQATLALVFALVTTLGGRAMLRSWRTLAQRTEELARSNADLERFAYAASHDLQTPLRNVVSYAQLLDRRYQGRLDADADAFIGYIVDGAKHMSTMITDLLEYALIGSAGQAAAVPVPAGQAVKAALAQLRGKVEAAGARVTVGALPVLLGDSRQLTRLFYHLIDNALTYRHSERAPKIDIGAEPAGGGMWRFTVRDNGVGIDAAYFDKIFVIFQRLEPVRIPQGSGIGLAFCRRIVESHGGAIAVESEPGKGAAFLFTFPAAPGRAGHAGG